MSRVRNHTSHKDLGVSRRHIVVILDDINFSWAKRDLETLLKMRKQKKDFYEIGAYFERDPDEVMMAAVHLARKEFTLPHRLEIEILQNADFIWDEDDLLALADMWKKYCSLKYMANYFKRDPDEVFLACIHLARQSKIVFRGNKVKGQVLLNPQKKESAA